MSRARRKKPASDLERQELSARIAKTLAETRRIELEMETTNSRARRFFSCITQSASLGTFVIALAAIGTLALDLSVDSRSQEDRRLEFEQKVLSDLVSPLPYSRATSAVSLKELIRRSGSPELLLPPLVDAASVERIPFVKATQLTVLRSYPKAAIGLLHQIRSHQDAVAVAAMEERGKILRKLDRQKDEGAGSAEIDSTRSTISAIQRRIVDAQYGAVHASHIIRELTCPVNGKCGLDLSGLHLRAFPFFSSQIDYNRAIFRTTNLTVADFFGVQLVDAVFDGAEVDGVDFRQAIVRGASFANAIIALPQGKLSETEWEKCIHTSGTVFPADVTNVDFSNADLTGANFGESNIGREQLDKAAKWSGAILPSQLAAVMKYQNPEPLAKRLEGKRDKRECRI